MSGGSTRISGGTNHRGMDTTRASKAMAVEPSDQPRLFRNEPPRLRASPGKRRSATSASRVGVMNVETSSSEPTTMSGVTAKMTMSGASTVLSWPMPTVSSQFQSMVSSAADSSQSRTASSAPSQKK